MPQDFYIFKGSASGTRYAHKQKAASFSLTAEAER